MADYIETFEIGTHRFGIEAPNGKNGWVYKIWHGGCGISGAQTLSEARGYIHLKAIEYLSADKAKLDTAWADMAVVLSDLGDGTDIFCLAKFLKR